MKIAFVGNCQMGAYDKIIDALGRDDLSIHVVETWALGAEDMPAALETIEGSDIIIQQPHYAPRHAPFHVPAMADRFPDARRLVIHNLLFAGPYPDLVSLPPPVRSGLSGYHSVAVIEAFLKGRSEAEALDAFLRVGETEGPEAVWARSFAQFRARQQAVDVAFDEDLEAFVRQRPCFHTLNHPNTFLLSRYAEAFLRVALDEPDLALPENAPDPLAWHGTWPIVPSVRERLDLPYGAEPFVIPRRLAKSVMSYEDYIAEAYGFYAQADPALLADARRRKP